MNYQLLHILLTELRNLITVHCLNRQGLQNWVGCVSLSLVCGGGKSHCLNISCLEHHLFLPFRQLNNGGRRTKEETFHLFFFLKKQSPENLGKFDPCVSYYIHKHEPRRNIIAFENTHFSGSTVYIALFFKFGEHNCKLKYFFSGSRMLNFSSLLGHAMCRLKYDITK